MVPPCFFIGDGLKQRSFQLTKGESIKSMKNEMFMKHNEISTNSLVDKKSGAGRLAKSLPKNKIIKPNPAYFIHSTHTLIDRSLWQLQAGQCKCHAASHEPNIHSDNDQAGVVRQALPFVPFGNSHGHTTAIED